MSEEENYKKWKEDMIEMENQANQRASEEYLKSTEYTNQLLEESLKVMEIIGKHTIKIYYVLLGIIPILAWIMFAVVFQVEPWWK